jgi:hypothetical protein
VPSGPGFNIIFCPGGRSSNILTAEARGSSETSHGQVSFGGTGSHIDKKPARFHHESMERMAELKRREEYDWTGADAANQPLGGVRVLELVKRGLHLRDWEAKRRLELRTQEVPGRIRSLLRMRSGAPGGATAAGEVKSVTLYMIVGLAITACVFMML